MDKAEKKETTSGIVTEALPNAQFRVKIGADQEVLAYLAGRMRLHRIRVLIGDKVELVLDDYGGRGRIVRRF
ncbi:MAG: translation initiation factor IF-1 [Candidatus Vogelbacteria bacterium]|nr:translation initiation factor IF-1 [Candidatus Vogelbacteria bacterium]